LPKFLGLNKKKEKLNSIFQMEITEWKNLTIHSWSAWSQPLLSCCIFYSPKMYLE